MRCSGCGHSLDETMDKHAQHNYTAKVLRCHACAAKERAMKERARDENADDAGVFYVAEEIKGQ